jgi:hypothetical protein
MSLENKRDTVSLVKLFLLNMQNKNIPPFEKYQQIKDTASKFV